MTLLEKLTASDMVRLTNLDLQEIFISETIEKYNDGILITFDDDGNDGSLHIDNRHLGESAGAAYRLVDDFDVNWELEFFRYVPV